MNERSRSSQGLPLGPLMVSMEGTALGAEDRALLRHPSVGGVILFARNYRSPAELVHLTAEIRELRAPALVIGVDQEGGRVLRFGAPFTPLPPAARFGALHDDDPELALQLVCDTGWLLGTELGAVGIDFSFVPVLDLNTGASTVIGERAYHSDPRVVAALAMSLRRGLLEAGVSAVGKHFPGHGSVAEDSHFERPVDIRSYEVLGQRDLLPFRLAIASGLGAILTAHIEVPKVDSSTVTFSSRWLGEILRQELGFNGLILSDDLSMQGAETVEGDNRAVRALLAGCDVPLVCNDRAAALRAADAVARLPASSLPQRNLSSLRRAPVTKAALRFGSAGELLGPARDRVTRIRAALKGLN